MKQIWWERVPNALSFFSSITQMLIAEKSIVIQHTNEIPWYSFFEEKVKNAVQQENSSKRVECIEDTDNPGQYLLQNFCKKEKRALYRPTKSLGCFLAENDDIVLHSVYLWVYIRDESSLARWMNIISDYQKMREKGKEVACFILVWHGEKIRESRKGIKAISFDEYLTEYDHIVFATLASASISAPPITKQYLSELAASTLGDDIELCAACLKRANEFLRDPFALISDITKSETRCDGSEYSYNKNESMVKHCIWKAQIKAIYPLLEQFREDFVQKHASAIMKQLPISSAFGEEYTDPKDVELGTLVFMVGSQRLVISPGEYDKLIRYRDARNVLSHLNILGYDDIQSL